MNVQQMHLAVQQGVDKINSLQADMLLLEEIDLELNKSLSKFINTKYNKNNLYRKGFEESQKRIDDLRSLVREFRGPVTYKEQVNSFTFVDTFNLPSDYRFLVSQQSDVIYRRSCKRIRWILELPDTELLYPFITVSLSDFILNSNTTIPNSIELVEDSSNLATSATAVIWSNTSSLTYPSDISALIDSMTDPSNIGSGFTVYWEQYGIHNYPGQFIIIVNTDTHNWYNWDLSTGLPVTEVITYDASNNEIQSIDAMAPVTFILDEKRVATHPSTGLVKDTVNNSFVQHDDIFTLLGDPFNKTKRTDPLTTIRNSSIDIYTNDIFIIDSVKITYIRNPRNISLSLGIDCELPDHTHQEIVDMTVSSILEGISDPRYKSHQSEVSKNE
mgnify:FL=1